MGSCQSQAWISNQTRLGNYCLGKRQGLDGLWGLSCVFPFFYIYMRCLCTVGVLCAKRGIGCFLPTQKWKLVFLLLVWVFSLRLGQLGWQWPDNSQQRTTHFYGSIYVWCWGTNLGPYTSRVKSSFVELEFGSFINIVFECIFEKFFYENNNWRYE